NMPINKTTALLCVKTKAIIFSLAIFCFSATCVNILFFLLHEFVFNLFSGSIFHQHSLIHHLSQDKDCRSLRYLQGCLHILANNCPLFFCQLKNDCLPIFLAHSVRLRNRLLLFHFSRKI